jgi:hypothetical protein
MPYNVLSNAIEHFETSADAVMKKAACHPIKIYEGSCFCNHPTKKTSQFTKRQKKCE